MAESEGSTEENLHEQSAADAKFTPEETAQDGSGGTSERLCDAFLDRYASMMNHENMASILVEQEHM